MNDCDARRQAVALGVNAANGQDVAEDLQTMAPPARGEDSPKQSRVGTNSGHGHVWKRPDGVVARCGGPAMCDKCRRDKLEMDRESFVDTYSQAKPGEVMKLAAGIDLAFLPEQSSGPRRIRTHEVNGLNEALVIGVLDGPGPGGANHVYQIALNDGAAGGHELLRTLCTLKFQNGPIGEAGFNGLSNEAVMAVVADRLEGFQNGPFACRENELALNLTRAAMHILKGRTRERMARGVEGTNQV